MGSQGQVRHRTNGKQGKEPSSTGALRRLYVQFSGLYQFIKEKLRKLSQQPGAAWRRCRLREGTTDEWRVITGLAEGNIVSRRLPDIVRSVLCSKERVRLLRTVQQQMEGELYMKLRSEIDIRVIRQKASTIKEDILLAAEGAKVNQDELQTMLHVTKHINYNDVQRSIHFHCFDRATARKYELMSVPFRGAIYRLYNCTSRTRVPYGHTSWNEMGCAWRPIRGTRWNFTMLSASLTSDG